MILSKTLQRVGEWIESSVKVTTGVLSTRVSPGSLKELGDLGGAVGAVFKIASWVIPEPTAEQLIATTLLRTFVESAEKAIAKNSDLCTSDEWTKYIRGEGQGGAEKLLAQEFSWLSIFGGRGQRPSRSWPLVADLADVAEVWFTGAATARGPLTHEAKLTVQTIRGDIADDLAAAVEVLRSKPAVREAWEKARNSAGREALDLLAEVMSTLDRGRLFNEVPQSALYIAPSLKRVDFAKQQNEKVDWEKVEAEKGWGVVLDHIQPGAPRLIVIHGDMGSGKSCLMRKLAAESAQRYQRDKNLAPVFVRWREIYSESDLLAAIAKRVSIDYQLPFDDLPDQKRIAYFVDGFDEMSSHDPTIIFQLFTRLAKLVQDHQVTVVVAMRSTVVTPNVQQEWFERKAFVIQIQPFSNKDVIGWVRLWQARTADIDVTGERLKALAGQEVTRNPLLLYMLARYVHPVARDGDPLSQADVFRTFVDETVTGKLRTDPAKFPLGVEFADNYRLLLQEMAYLASWPSSNGKCKERDLAEVMKKMGGDELNFDNVRTAFVLHFFDPGAGGHGEFEFHPEGFRQYLLAEWCARAQWESHQDPKGFRKAPFRRKPSEAAAALAQFPLQTAERDFLNDLLSGLGRRSRISPQTVTIRRLFMCLGVAIPKGQLKQANDSLNQFIQRQWIHVVDPPMRKWSPDSRVGIPKGQSTPNAIDYLRLLVNYWDQCLIGYLALARGLSPDTLTKPPTNDKLPLGRFLRLRNAVRGYSSFAELNLSRQSQIDGDLEQLSLCGSIMSQVDLRGANLAAARFIQADFRRSDLRNTCFREADLRGADLRGADLRGADLGEADLRHAILREVNLHGANLDKANLSGADLTTSDLSGAHLSEANLSQANLRSANLNEAELTGADLVGANLSLGFIRMANLNRADLSGADLSGATLDVANLVDANLRGALLSGANLTNAYLSVADLTNANLSGADLTNANLSGADLTNANLSGADLTNAKLARANLTGAILTKARLDPDQLYMTLGNPAEMPD